MTNLSSCPVFTLLLVIGIFIFLTSKMALDDYTISETNTVPFMTPISPRDRFWHLDRRNFKSSNFFVVVKNILAPDKFVPSPKQDSCYLKFQPKCTLSKNLIRYWEEETGCFESPLRNSSGFSAGRINDRRYLVFQPDLGGWNNIRMGTKSLMSCRRKMLSTLNTCSLSTYIFID